VNAQTVRDAIEVALTDRGSATRVVIIDLDINDEIDITSADMLTKLADHLERQGSTLVLAHLHQPALRVARKAGLLETIGDDHTFPNIATAVAWARHENREVGARVDGAPT
jgi:MFS superfamily sulfate permease-like transporter